MERQGNGRFHFKLTTNGVLLDEPFIEYSLKNDVLIAMSFDGIREAHDRHRALPNGPPPSTSCAAGSNSCSRPGPIPAS